ncbi:hypothetical protein [Ramlibacter sp.]|uniref:hypothetical protein n=1 Tax=Ramlibacter sp. TaxID=1917967 RepID=UPI0035B06AEC
MSDPEPGLLLQFPARDTQHGVTRKTVKAMAKRFDLSETEIVHIALARLAEEGLPAYAPDHGPLTARQVRRVQKVAAAAMPKGKVQGKQSLL